METPREPTHLTSHLADPRSPMRGVGLHEPPLQYSEVVEFVAGLFLGGLVGIVMTVILERPLQRYWDRLVTRVRRRLSPRSITPQHGVVADDFIQLMSWSPARPLDPTYHVATSGRTVANRDQIPIPGLPDLDDLRRDYRGQAGSIIGYRVDHGEAGRESRRFTIEVDSALYADGMAFQKALRGDAGWEAARRLVTDLGPSSLARLPTNTFFMNLTLTTASGNTLALRRSAGGVATGRGKWALGACETMTEPSELPGSRPEDLFDLARRTAEEEFGLARDEIGPIWVTWFGIGRGHGMFCVAHTSTRLTESTVEQRVLNSHASYESDGLRWIRVDDVEISSLAAAPPDEWLPLSKVSASDLTRLKDDLLRTPTRY